MDKIEMVLRDKPEENKNIAQIINTIRINATDKQLHLIRQILSLECDKRKYGEEVNDFEADIREKLLQLTK